ncbi:adenosylcobinamide amidohydrolase [Calidithermus timidus]|jgi:adenosylcobinamide hydrolase|uniref:adenosylcobinamide amidohydrolase n=1 Tax=Calidithermus timidus TaxID=307124 RepID=UPI00039ECC7A|nr:adenosylcobinamide amidohydrolase [Calidithermus timidus]
MWPKMTLRDRTLIVDLGASRRVLSSAPFRGGLSYSRYLVNRTVPKDFCPPDLGGVVRADLEGLGLPPGVCVAHLTAVDVAAHAYAAAEEGGVRVQVWLTAGLGNLAAPGLSPLALSRPGTINVLAVLHADLAEAAMVEAVQIVSEVKARCLRGRTTREGYPATGTSTDTVSVALLEGPKQDYCGAVTPAGRALGRAVDGALSAALLDAIPATAEGL